MLDLINGTGLLGAGDEVDLILEEGERSNGEEERKSLDPGRPNSLPVSVSSSSSPPIAAAAAAAAAISLFFFSRSANIRARISASSFEPVVEEESAGEGSGEREGEEDDEAVRSPRNEGDAPAGVG